MKSCTIPEPGRGRDVLNDKLACASGRCSKRRHVKGNDSVDLVRSIYNGNFCIGCAWRHWDRRRIRVVDDVERICRNEHCGALSERGCRDKGGGEREECRDGKDAFHDCSRLMVCVCVYNVFEDGIYVGCRLHRGFI